MSRRGRVPGTPGGRTFRLEVATGGRPVAALIRPAAAIPSRRGCPATPFGPMEACTCEIVELLARRAA